MKNYDSVKFILVVDNNDPMNFYIDVTIMKDVRLRLSALKGQHAKYLETGDLYRPIYKIFVTDFSFYCIFKGSFKNLDEIKQKKMEIISEYTAKFKCVEKIDKKGVIKFEM